MSSLLTLQDTMGSMSGWPLPEHVPPQRQQPQQARCATLQARQNFMRIAAPTRVVSDSQAEACRALWWAVLRQADADLRSPDSKVRWAARRFLLGQEGELDRVLWLAGLDPCRARQALRDRLDPFEQGL